MTRKQPIDENKSKSWGCYKICALILLASPLLLDVIACYFAVGVCSSTSFSANGFQNIQN